MDSDWRVRMNACRRPGTETTIRGEGRVVQVRRLCSRSDMAVCGGACPRKGQGAPPLLAAHRPIALPSLLSAKPIAPIPSHAAVIAARTCSSSFA